MSSERPTTVLVVGDSACQAAVALTDRTDIEARSTAESTPSLEDTDCVVACTPALATTTVVGALEAGIPILGCDCDDSIDGQTALLARVRAATGTAEPSESRLARLHTAAAELGGLTDRAALFDRVVDVASDVLDFDIVVVFEASEAGFDRIAATPGADLPEHLDDDHGLTAVVHRTEQAARVDDIEAHPVAASITRRYRSGVVVPIDGRYVFEGLSTRRAAYDASDLELAELLCDHVAQAAARLDAESNLQRREATVTALHRAAPGLIDAGDESTLYDLTVDIADRVLSFDRSYLLLADDDDGFRLVAGTDDDVSGVVPDAGILGRTYEERRPFLVDDVRADEDAEPAHDSTRAALSVPFGGSGVFQALSTDPAAYDETDVELAELLMSYAWATRDRIQSEAALRESRRVVERLHAAATDIAGAESEEDLLERAMVAIEDVLDFDKSSILLLDGEMLVPAVDSADSPPDGSQPTHVSEGFSGKTIRTGRSYRVDRMASDPDAEPLHEEYRSGISVPIGDLGVFQAAAGEEAAFADDHVELAELLMAHVAVSLERVRAETDRRAERDRLKALFENIPGAAVSYEMVDGRPHVDRVNEAFERTFGYPEREMVGESLDDYIVPPDDVDDAEEFNDRLLRGERVQAEVERLTADGPRHFLMQLIPLRVGVENSSGYVIYTDVTERREREEALRRQNERLDQFASVVSHDLRNPLNVASGYLQLAREQGDPDAFDKVRRALDRMDALVTDLLVLAREGRDVGETEFVALATVARQAWENVATGGAALRVETAREVEADADRLVELFENLFRNAVEHGLGDDGVGPGKTPDGGVSLDAGSASETDAASEIADPPLTVIVGDCDVSSGFFVADDGVGISTDFDPFETGKTTSDHGTGFGLAIVKSIAEAHGWSVSAGTGEVGRDGEACSDDTSGGARFEFTW